MSEYHYDMISIETINLLISMLSVNPRDRPHITKLISNLNILKIQIE